MQEHGKTVRAYPQFLVAFHTLEKSLPSVGEAIGVYATNAQKDIAAQRTAAIRVLAVVGVLGGLFSALLGVGLIRSLLRPLRRVGEGSTRWPLRRAPTRPPRSWPGWRPRCSTWSGSSASEPLSAAALPAGVTAAGPRRVRAR